ncbi:MAG: PspC domain-containing protein [Dehalococcoidia bacterium]|nr:PspC domain-containing protein [Dehalococcoidia bacterium]
MATNRLYRDTENAMLGGVCAGFAKRFDLDPTIVRVAVIGLAVLTVGTTVLLYLALWIIMPAGAEADTRRPSRDQLSEEFRGAGERVAEAGRIVSRAAKQAAGEISALQNRPASGESAAAEPASDAASSAEAPSTESSTPEAGSTEPGNAEFGNAESGNAEADESRTSDAPSSGTPGAPFTTPPAPPAGLQAPPPPPPPPPGPPDGPIPGPWGNDRPQQS